MSDKDDDGRDTAEPLIEAGQSVIEFLEQRAGEAPRVMLRAEDSAAVSEPLIDPSSTEKTSVPRGRGSYQLMGEIARGGMAVILKAHDTDLGRDVALKVLDKRLAERPDVVQRFVEEAQIGGQLQHPGIVPVYELGLMADERPFFTMKLVKGRTLATILTERESPSSQRRRLIDIFESICQTMAYAHSRGVIHRDLKPANIMVGAFGEVQVVDWGLAKVLTRGGTADEKRAREAHSNLTIVETVRSEGSGSGSDSMVGSILGTPAYMPPEQASGLVDRLDERTDVFALGAILCEILTGLPPYVGERDDVITAAAQADYGDALARLDACAADPALIKLTKQCLMAAPAARPANAGAVAERVHEYVTSIEERAHRAQVAAAEASVRAAEERKARKLTLALGTAVMAVVAVGGGGWLWVQNERAAQERANAEREQALARKDRELTGEVNASLQITASLQGGGRWQEAIDEARRARAMAEGGGASEALLAGIDATVDELRERKTEDDRRAERARDTQRLMDSLHDLGRPTETGSDAPAAAYRSIFLAHGIDLDAGEFEDAAALLTERGLGSEVALVLDSWSEARREEENDEGALRLLELAHVVDPDPERAHLREALANRDLDELEYLAETVLEDQPPSTIALLAAGLGKLGARESALRVYRAGVNLHPDDFGLLFGLGRFLTPGFFAMAPDAELQEALRFQQAALAINPQSISTRNGVAGLHTALGQFERATEHYELSLERTGDNPFSVFLVARAYMVEGRFDASIELFEQIVDEPRRGVGYWSLNNIAVMRLEQGDTKGALEAARRSWAAAPNTNTFFNSGLLTVFAKASVALDSEEPMIEARRLFDELGASALAMNNLARFTLDFLTRGEDPRVLMFETASSLNPRAGSKIVGLLLEHVIEMAGIAVAREPETPGYWHTLGVARFHHGKYEGALEALAESERLASEGSVENWLYLAMSHHGLAQPESAKEWYERAVARMSARPSTQYALRVRDEARSFLGTP